MHGDDVFHAEQANGMGRIARAHGEEIADRQHRQDRLVQLTD